MSGYREVRQSLGQSRKIFCVWAGAVSYLESMALACG